LEIIRGKLLAIADEMGLVLARSSMSPLMTAEKLLIMMVPRITKKAAIWVHAFSE
jgi:hypothetical protein